MSHPILRDYDKYQVAFMTSVAILELRDALLLQLYSSDSWEPRTKNTKKSSKSRVRVRSLSPAWPAVHSIIREIFFTNLIKPPAQKKPAFSGQDPSRYDWWPAS